MPAPITIPSVDNDKLAGSLNNLDLLFEIFRWLEPADLVRLMLTAKFYRFYIAHRNDLWRLLSVEYFGDENNNTAPTKINKTYLMQILEWANSLYSTQEVPEAIQYENFKKSWQKIYVADGTVDLKNRYLLSEERSQVIKRLFKKAELQQTPYLDEFFKKYPGFTSSVSDEEALLFFTAAGTDSENILKYFFRDQTYLIKLAQLIQNIADKKTIGEHIKQIKAPALFEYIQKLHSEHAYRSTSHSNACGDFCSLFFDNIDPALLNFLTKQTLLLFVTQTKKLDLVIHYLNSDKCCENDSSEIFSSAIGVGSSQIFQKLLESQNDKFLELLINNHIFFKNYMMFFESFCEDVAQIANRKLLSTAILNIAKFYNVNNYTFLMNDPSYQNIPKDLIAIYQKLTSYMDRDVYPKLSIHALCVLEKYVTTSELKSHISQIINKRENLELSQIPQLEQNSSSSNAVNNNNDVEVTVNNNLGCRK